MQWVYCWKVCLCFALHVEVQIYDGTPLKCIVCCTAVKVKTLPPQYFFIVINQEIGVFQRAVLPGDVLLVTSQLWIAYLCWAWHWYWCLAASSPLEQCRCWPGLPVSGAPVTASLTAGSSTYPHVTGHPIHSFKYLHVRRWMPCVNLDFSDISSVVGNYLCFSVESLVLAVVIFACGLYCC